MFLLVNRFCEYFRLPTRTKSSIVVYKTMHSVIIFLLRLGSNVKSNGILDSTVSLDKTKFSENIQDTKIIRE